MIWGFLHLKSWKTSLIAPVLKAFKHVEESKMYLVKTVCKSDNWKFEIISTQVLCWKMILGKAPIFANRIRRRLFFTRIMTTLQNGVSSHIIIFFYSGMRCLQGKAYPSIKIVNKGHFNQQRKTLFGLHGVGSLTEMFRLLTAVYGSILLGFFSHILITKCFNVLINPS